MTHPSNEVTERDLAPCPFCGSANIDPCAWTSNSGQSGPGCDDCGALGDSEAAWNRRTPTAAIPRTSAEAVQGPLVGCGDGNTRIVMEPPTIWKSRLVADTSPVPAQTGTSAEAYRDCCDTPHFCSAVRRCTAKDEERATPAPADSAMPSAGQLADIAARFDGAKFADVGERGADCAAIGKSDSAARCDYCAGSGEVYFEGVGAPCPHCNGSGQESDSAAERDAARLDFIDTSALHVQTCYAEGSEVPVYEICIVHGAIEDDSLQCIGTGATLREAIDAAIAAMQPTTAEGKKT